MARRHSRSNFKLYAIITLVCGALAVLAHFLFEAPSKVREYAESEIQSAARDAVRGEVKAAASQPR